VTETSGQKRDIEDARYVPIIGMYSPPQNCKRKTRMDRWSAPMCSVFGGVEDC